MGRKRKSGEGTVRLRKDGRWEGRIVIGYDEKGLPPKDTAHLCGLYPAVHQAEVRRYTAE